MEDIRYHNNGEWWVDLINLPKRITSTKKVNIDWNNSINKIIPFYYNDISGILTIIGKNKTNIVVSYGNYEFEINMYKLSTAQLETYMGTYDRRYKYNVNDILSNEFGSIIIKSQIRLNGCKAYEYECLCCGNKDIIREESLKSNSLCHVCRKYMPKVICGVNDIATTHPHLVKYFVNIEDAKKYSFKYELEILCKCPDCGNKEYKKLQTLIKDNYFCSKCNDSISYPNKLGYNLLKQLNIQFSREYSPNWIKPKRYDFYFKLKDKEYIIEMDGGLGHGNKNTLNGQSAEETQAIDGFKDKMAKEHDIEVIRIDCLKSEIEYIKNNILHSRLNELFNLDKINWNECHEFSVRSLVKEICEYWEGNKYNVAITKVGEMYKLNNNTITSYLKQGSECGFCDYQPNKNYIGYKNRNTHKKAIVCIDNNYIFNSISECSQLSENVFGVKLQHTHISKVCMGKLTHHKGYHFKYLADLSCDELTELKNNWTDNEQKEWKQLIDNKIEEILQNRQLRNQ